jgi:dihydroorotase
VILSAPANRTSTYASRRAFLRACGALPAVACAAWPQAAPRYDILILNGEVHDPARGFRRKADVGILDGKVAAIEPSIPKAQGIDVIDAGGLHVTPGLVDLHAHVYHGFSFGVEPDPLARRSGVTTMVDAGTFDGLQVDAFRKYVVEPSQCRVYGYVFLYPSNRNPDDDPLRWARRHTKATGEAALANRDFVLGVKYQVGSNMAGRYTFDFLKIARELCDEFKLPMMLHISFAPPDTDQVMELMKPGDVVTHCYNTHTLGILDSGGKVKPSVLAARERGVLFDIGHGAGSFNFEIARKALDQGFLPDTISTDVYDASINGPVFDMPTTMSKMLHLGMSFDDVLARSTVSPAKIVNRLAGMGSLQVGSPADIALLAIEEGEFKLVDAQWNEVSTPRRIVSRLTICRGRRMLG